MSFKFTNLENVEGSSPVNWLELRVLHERLALAENFGISRLNRPIMTLNGQIMQGSLAAQQTYVFNSYISLSINSISKMNVKSRVPCTRCRACERTRQKIVDGK